jgi:hemolysin activation/secretion protein
MAQQTTKYPGRRWRGNACRLTGCIAASLACIPLLFPPAASAQLARPSPVQAIGEGLRRQTERAQELQQRLLPGAYMPQPEPAAPVSTTLPKEQPCFTINAVELKSADAVRFGWLADTALPFLHQCAGVYGLRQIAAALDAKLFALGYITSRVTLPQQNLANGVLTIRLHVGRVGQVAMFDATGEQRADNSWGTWRNAFPVSPGDVLDAGDIEQGVEQMKRLPSQAVTTELTPGAEADTSDVRILRRPAGFAQRIHGGLNIDNSGSRALGASQAARHIVLDNPLGQNDIVALSASSNARHPAADHRSQSLSLDYSIPWGYNTFSFSASRSRFAQRVQGTTVEFLSSGASSNAEVRWHRTMLRTSAARAGMYAAVATRRANSYLDDVELLVQRRRTASLETGFTYKQLLGEASVEFELGYRQGMPWRGAQEDLPTAASGGLTLRPRIALFNGSYRQPFTLAGPKAQYQASLRAQGTHDTTLSVDQFAIGNRYSVRGFDGDSVLLAESGYTLRNEFSMPQALPGGVDGVAYLGIDIGRVWGAGAALRPGQTLAGVVFGMRMQWRRLQLDAALGTPLCKPDGFRTLRWNPYLYLTYAF